MLCRDIKEVMRFRVEAPGFVDLGAAFDSMCTGGRVEDLELIGSKLEPLIAISLAMKGFVATIDPEVTGPMYECRIAPGLSISSLTV